MSPSDRDPVLYNIMLTRFFWSKVVCWSDSIVILCWLGSSGIKSPADQNQMLYYSMLARFFWYNFVCWSGPSVILQLDILVHHLDPALYNSMLTRFFGIKSRSDQDSVLYNNTIKSPVDLGPVLYNSMLTRFISYTVVCWPESCVILFYRIYISTRWPVLLVCSRLLIRIQFYLTSCWPGSVRISRLLIEI